MPDSPNKFRRRYERERTARLEAERLLEEKADELYASLMKVQTSEGLLRTALSSMADGLLLTNPCHEVILANERLRAIYPDLAECLVPDSRLDERFELLLGHPDYRALLNKEVTQAHFELTLDDQRVVSVTARHTTEGFIASTHSEITDLKAAEEERRHLLVDLLRAQRMETIGRMSGMIAHDFNNIIASIKGYAGFLEEDLAEQPQLLDSAHRIASSASRAEELIQQILEYGNQQQAPRHRVSLVPVIEDCLDMAIPGGADAVRLEFEPPDEPIWIEGNESRLGQLFMNLLTNARRAMAGRDESLAILCERFDRLELGETACDHPGFPAGDTCSTWSGLTSFPGPCVRVTVIDNGMGIAPEVMERIFEMYFSTRDDSTHGGVGMSSVADIVADYGGGIRVISRPGAGTAVEVAFPIQEAEVFFPRPVPAHRAGPAPGGSDVMVIDDDVDVGNMIQFLLERAGISAEYHSDPRVAADLLLEDASRWKVVLCDQIMPHLKGSDIFLQLREAGIAIPFILCSAQLDPASGEVHDWVKDDFVPKPIDTDLLLEKVRRYL